MVLRRVRDLSNKIGGCVRAWPQDIFYCDIHLNMLAVQTAVVGAAPAFNFLGFLAVPNFFQGVFVDIADGKFFGTASIFAVTNIAFSLNGDAQRRDSGAVGQS